MIPNGQKLYRTAIKYTNIFHSKALQNTYTQIGIFGLKINHLATLVQPKARDPESDDVRGPDFEAEKWVSAFFLRFFYSSFSLVYRKPERVK
jgi:hypothetical protein